MNRFFSVVKDHTSNLYIADYTLQSNGQKKVQISNTPFTNIPFFSINNPTNHFFQSVNFEKNKLKNCSGNLIKQCECLCASRDNNGWICLIELKYCTAKNIRGNVSVAYQQLVSTYNFIKSKNVLAGRKLIYLIFSLPEHNRAPFENFIFTQAELQRIRRSEGYIIRGINSIEIENATHLKV